MLQGLRFKCKPKYEKRAYILLDIMVEASNRRDFPTMRRCAVLLRKFTNVMDKMP